MIAAIVLAAGESKRMNSPKALLQIGRETFVQCVTAKIRACGVDPIYVVAGAHFDAIRSAFEESITLFEILFNARYREGQLLSLQAGLGRLPPSAMGVLVWPVDQPLVKIETVRKLISVFETERGNITIPSFKGRRGHPVIYDTRAIQTLLSFSGRQTAKDVQTIYAAQTSIVEVDDPAVLIDIDSPEDYNEYIKRGGL